MKTLNTPYTMHENTVMESEFDEVQTKATRKRKRKPHRTRADHKHEYHTAYCESHYKSQVTGKVTTTYHLIKYCAICGRISNARFIATNYDDIPAGLKVFRTSVDDGIGYLAMFIPDLTDFFIKE